MVDHGACRAPMMSAHRSEPGEKLVEAFHAVVDFLPHSGLELSVTVLDCRENGVLAQHGLASVFGEGDDPEGDVTWPALKLEGLNDAVKGWDAVEAPPNAYSPPSGSQRM